MVGPEYVQVEEPLLRQLADMGWEHLAGGPQGAFAPSDPAASGRESFAEVLLLSRLRTALRKINLGPDGRPWLDDQRISQAIGALTRIGASGLLEANRTATDLLIQGIPVEGLPGWDGGRDQRVHFIDWRHWSRNDFTVVSQFRVDIPGAQGRDYIVPDEVLFVNGIPLAVVECKKPGRGDAILEGVTQIKRYAERRYARVREGNRRLFHTVQLTIATCGERARLGTFTAEPEHYVPWRDAYPLTDQALAAALGKDEAALTEQDRLAAVVLNPQRLLAIVHDYVTFMPLDDRIVKIAPRYQQYRAVEKAIDRLLTGETRPMDGVQDRRGGIIWHTQGSGKSLTMTFFVRRMRSIEDLAATKVVLVTDRTQLQRQLRATMELTGESVDVADSVKDAKAYLSQHGPGLVFVMIQKQRDRAARGGGLAETTPSLGELNADESIVVLIDEAHRSHGSALHMNLLEALPNCARIGFTGTPIIMGKRKKTTQIFGSFIDKYLIADAERDGAVVQIFYEGHTVKGAVRDGRDLDEFFEDMFAEHTEQEREELQRRYGTRTDVLEADELIAAKARHMLRHYIATVLPGGFKAQLVASSRLATVKYRDALMAARDEIVREAERLPEHLRGVDPEELSPRRAARVQAWRHLDLLRAMEFVPVISAGTSNDEQRFSEWSDERRQDDRVEAFKRPFPAEIREGDRPIAFLIVKSMLLTGFDAPIEQVLYVDRSLKQAELLQAVARVNRTAENKKCGYVVDYYGVTHHLAEALRAYASEDVDGALKDIGDEIAKLGPRARRVRALFTERGVEPGGTTLEDCVRLLEDGVLFDRFEAELRRFLSTVDTVLPNPAVRPFLADVRLFSEIALRARRRYRVDGGAFDPSLYGAKVRELIDEHLVSLGIEEKLPPVSLTADDFDEKVAALPDARARASEMEHAVRDHLDVNTGRDPHLYRRFSERLEEILREYAQDWEQQARELTRLIEDMRAAETDDDGPLSPVERALYGVLLERTAEDGVPDEETDRRLSAIATEIYYLAIQETARRDFWRGQVNQEGLRRQVAQRLILHDIGPLESPAIADELVEVIRRNWASIPRP